MNYTSGSVKIMLSFDYCHFEIALSSDNIQSLKDVDDMRKEAQRLADKAVTQYQIAKKLEQKKANSAYQLTLLKQQVDSYRSSVPESEFTEEMKAKISLLQELEYLIDLKYDYEYDFDYPL